MTILLTNCKLVLCVSILISTTCTTTAFILDKDQCIVSTPSACSCDDYGYENQINCDWNQLREIPNIGLSNSTADVSEIKISMKGNQLTFIKKHAFYNIRYVNTSTLSLDFESNQVASIDIYAFVGVETIITELNLKKNHLSSLPAALITLTRLEKLELEGNPLSSLEPYVLNHLGNSLKEFSLDMGKLQSWPNDLNKLKHLRSLQVFFIPFSQLPQDAFIGMEQSLGTLTISNSQLGGMPVAICNLSKLYSFTFENNAVLQHTLFEECSDVLAAMTNLYLGNNSLKIFPNMLHLFPSLVRLDMDNNMLHFIETHKVPPGIPIDSLSLDDNQLTRIPPALNEFHQLRFLYLKNNKIFAIEDPDIAGLSKLTRLRMNNNPLEHVSDNAFKYNQQMNLIEMESTKMYSVPNAVKFLPHLSALRLGDNIVCDCNMSYLKGWNVTSVSFYSGTCSNNRQKNIKQYIVDSLPNCP